MGDPVHPDSLSQAFTDARVLAGIADEGAPTFHELRSLSKRLHDTEGVVTAHLPGKGKYTGMMGALQIEMSDGRRFKLGTGFTDAVRNNPPPPGSTVTYTYRDFTKSGLPRFASFLRVREDP